MKTYVLGQKTCPTFPWFTGNPMQTAMELNLRYLGQSVSDMWWTKWHWDEAFYKYFGFPLSVSFHQCSILTVHLQLTLLSTDTDWITQ